MTWHADTDMLARYAAGTLDYAHAASLEAHLLTCAACRAATTAVVSPGPLTAVWDDLVDRLDAPPGSPLERALLRLRVPAHIARLLAATPSLRLSWLGGVAAALAFAVLAAHSANDPRAVAMFLLLAPILPVAGVAVSYGPLFDPAADVTAAAPTDDFRVLLLRAFAVVSATTVLTGMAALALPVAVATAMAWLLPALAMTTATLALGQLLPLRWAGTGLAAAWTLVALLTANPFQPTPATFAAFEPAGQAASAAVVIALAGAQLLRRLGSEPVRTGGNAW